MPLSILTLFEVFLVRIGVARLRLEVFDANYAITVHFVRKSKQLATDYDAPRKSDDEESLEAIKEGAPAKAVDISDEGDHSEAYVMPEVSFEEDDVVVVPIQAEEFTCMECFIVKHNSLIAKKSKIGNICTECAS